MNEERGRALVLARAEDVARLEQKLRARGYEVDTFTSASQVNLDQFKEYAIVCIGGTVSGPDDAVAAIEQLTAYERGRAPRRRLRAV